MGSLSKRLGQLAAKSLESESSNIIRTIQANKVPGSLSQLLDTTLKESHDMRVFGLGTLSAMSSVDRYARFTNSMFGVYSTMEEELDKCSEESGASAYFWNRHEKILRRSTHLRNDIADVTRGVDNEHIPFSPATEEYILAIRKAGDEDRQSGGARLLGHAYTRYLADLMGGQMLAEPTRLALRLERGTPRQYCFDFPEGGRRRYVETIYRDLNEAANFIRESDEDNLEAAVDEARLAFSLNVKVYSEEPIALDSLVGISNIITGWVMRK